MDAEDLKKLKELSGELKKISEDSRIIKVVIPPHSFLWIFPDDGRGSYGTEDALFAYDNTAKGYKKRIEWEVPSEYILEEIIITSRKKGEHTVSSYKSMIGPEGKPKVQIIPKKDGK